MSARFSLKAEKPFFFFFVGTNKEIQVRGIETPPVGP
jgi:hypothetical protein